MSTGKLIAKNTLIQAAGKAVSTILGVAVVAIITRAIGPAGYGKYTTVITFLSFFGIIADFGLTLIAAQMISEQGADEGKILRSIFTFRVLTAFLMFALAPVAAFFTDYPVIVKLGIALTAWSFFFVSLQQTLVGVFQKRLAMQYPMVAEIIGRVALLVVTVYAAAFGKNVLWFLGAVVVGNIVNFFCVQNFVRRFVKIGFGWDRVVLREMLRRSLPIAVSIVFNLIYLKADMLILTFVRPDAVVGLYGAAYRVIDILMMLPVMVMGVVLPVATGAWSAGDRERTARIIQKTFDGFILYIMPVLVGGFLVAGPIMQLVAGSEFVAAGAPLKILLLAFAAATLSTLFGHTIVALGKQKQVVWVYGLDAILSLSAYLIFIPRYGMTAAAWATFGSEFFAAVVLGAVVLKAVRQRLMLNVVGFALVASVVMGFVIWGISSWPVAIIILVAAVVYGLLLGAGKMYERFI